MRACKFDCRNNRRAAQALAAALSTSCAALVVHFSPSCRNRPLPLPCAGVQNNHAFGSVTLLTLGRFVQGYLFGKPTDGGLHESRIISIPIDVRGSSHHQQVEMESGDDLRCDLADARAFRPRKPEPRQKRNRQRLGGAGLLLCLGGGEKRTR